MTSRDPRRCCEAVRSAILATAWLLVVFSWSWKRSKRGVWSVSERRTREIMSRRWCNVTRKPSTFVSGRSKKTRSVSLSFCFSIVSSAVSKPWENIMSVPVYTGGDVKPCSINQSINQPVYTAHLCCCFVYLCLFIWPLCGVCSRAECRPWITVSSAHLIWWTSLCCNFIVVVCCCSFTCSKQSSGQKYESTMAEVISVFLFFFHACMFCVMFMIKVMNLETSAVEVWLKFV